MLTLTLHAPMSSTDTDSPTLIFPLQRDDPSAAEPARRRLAPKKSFLQLLHLSPKKAATSNNPLSTSSSTSLASHLYVTDPSADADDPSPQLVQIEDEGLHLNQLDDNSYDKDVYRWAVLYENQRG